MTRFISAREILEAHFKLVEKYGGSHGTRDIERVKSAVAAPKQVVFGQEQYPDLFEKAAIYARNIIGDHPFNDGNKRTGITIAVTFLWINGKNLSAKKGELEDFALKIAVDRLDVAAIATWLRGHTK